MALERSARPLARCWQCTRHNRIPSRSISATTHRAQEETTTEPLVPAEPPPPPPPSLPANYVTTSKGLLNREKLSNPRKERLLTRGTKELPIGSRRRRAALASSRNIPFSELPYQCFQEARNILKDDRTEKVDEIEDLKAKIAKWNATEVPPEREAMKEKRIKSWTDRIEELKILADSNDPLVKKNFEDGFGDMNKPIYRHLSDLKWRSHKREVLMQRIKQMNVVPDVLPAIDPTVSTVLSFRQSKVAHGDFVLAATSEKPPVLEIQTYEKGKKLVTIAIVTPDVPNVEKDGFEYRCHFLAANVRIEPTKRYVHLGSLGTNANIIHDWLPPYSQKGAPYQRLAVFVLEQPSSIPIPGATVGDTLMDVAEAKELVSEATAPEPSSTAKSERAAAETAPESASKEVSSPVASAASESMNTVAETVPEAVSNEAMPSEPTTSGTTAFQPSYVKPIGPGLSDATNPKTPVPERLDVAAIKQHPRYSKRENFILRSFVDKYRLRPIGVDLFRAQWDETTADVMRRNGITGHDVEFKRKRVDPLPYQRLKGERYR